MAPHARSAPLLYVVALSAAVQGESLRATGSNPSTWLDLLDAGWAGRAAVARLILVVASVWVVLRPERVIDPTTQLPALALPTLAVVTLGLSRTGGELAILGVIAGIAHSLAMAIWVGGVVLLARVVLAGPGEEDLVHAVRGFNRISGPAIVVTVVSGLVQLYRLDGGSLFSESHGRVLLLKTVLVAVMLFVGLTARQVAQARLARANDLSPPTADRLRRAFGTEAAIGVVVIGLQWLADVVHAGQGGRHRRTSITRSRRRSSTQRPTSTSRCRSPPARSVSTSCAWRFAVRRPA